MIIDSILKELELCGFKVSTDTRKDVSGSVYFALKGESFDGNDFVKDALQKGARAAVTDNPKNYGDNIYVVDDVLKTLEKITRTYRKSFSIPIIAIGGSNGKTTSKELAREVLNSKYKVHATEGSLNNHFGLPLSILSMPKYTDIGVFEIGANHPGEHLDRLNILEPTHIVVTNNGLDHLEGFGSPEGARLANKEIYDFAKQNGAKAFVNKNHKDLITDSEGIEKILYPQENLSITSSMPLTLAYNGKTYETHMTGDYNLENIQLALAVGKEFNIDADMALQAVCNYIPSSKRSQFVTKNGIDFVVDCYNANPSSMKLSFDSFIKSGKAPRGVVLGDMLELGEYAEAEHRNVVEYVLKQNLDVTIFIGENFKKALGNKVGNYHWFADSEEAKIWFAAQKFSGFTFLLKGSRGIRVEKVLDM